MKRLLLPLLAALALPTAINAETIYLGCTANNENKYKFSITINEANLSSLITFPNRDGTTDLIKGNLFATSDAFVIRAAYSPNNSDLYQRFEISRVNGSFLRYMGSVEYPVKVPETKVLDGICIKEKKKKTLF